MKSFFVFVLGAAMVFCVVDAAKSCESFMDCGITECCKEQDYLVTTVKRCKPLQEDGDYCLGKYLCDCKMGLMCVEREDSILNPLKLGKGHCRPIANTANFREW